MSESITVVVEASMNGDGHCLTSKAELLPDQTVGDMLEMFCKAHGLLPGWDVSVRWLDDNGDNEELIEDSSIKLKDLMHHGSDFLLDSEEETKGLRFGVERKKIEGGDVA